MDESTDLIQLAREALVSIIDTHPDIIAITERENDPEFPNVVAWNPDAIVRRPVVAYQFITAPELDADGDERLALFQLSASADDDATANELLGVIERILTYEAFLSLSTPLDAYVESRVRRGFDLDVTLRVNRATPLPS